MKANELQIGDWVSIKCGRQLQLGLEQFWAQFSHENEENPIDYFGDFEPIPLTEEILIANGFGKSYTDNMNAHYSKSGVGVTLNFASYTTTIMGKLVVICYVHELQHALRLCAPRELADNFKVE